MSTLATNSSGNGKEQMSCGGSSSGSNSIAAAGGGNRRPRALSQPDIFSGAEASVQRRRRLGRARRASVASLVIPGVHVTPPTPREIDISKLEFLFRKQLKNSDVGVLRRIVLPKKECETNLPILESKKGIPITMFDMDGIHQWSFKYRYWQNSSKMYVLEYTGEFVHKHNLTVNDSIIVYRNIDDGEYIIEGRKKMEEDVSKTYTNVGMCELYNELTVPDDPILGSIDLLYEYESKFMDDSPFNYLGDPIKLPNMGSDSSFEDYNIKDFDFNFRG